MAVEQLERSAETVGRLKTGPLEALEAPAFRQLEMARTVRGVAAELSHPVREVLGETVGMESNGQPQLAELLELAEGEAAAGEGLQVWPAGTVAFMVGVEAVGFMVGQGQEGQGAGASSL